MGLKGHTRVELTDIKTGQQEIIESDNMFTNGLTKVLNSLDHIPNCINNEQASTDETTGTNAYGYYPIVGQLLGGIMCFDTALSENADNFIPPYPSSGIKMTACANMSLSDTVEIPERGSLNMSESGWNDDKTAYTFVWDFTTSQGNGNIASLGLTTNAGGINGTKMDMKSKNGMLLSNPGYNVATANITQRSVAARGAKDILTTSNNNDSSAWWNTLLSSQEIDAETEGYRITCASPDIKCFVKDFDIKNGIVYCAHIEVQTDANNNQQLVLFDYKLLFDFNEISLAGKRMRMKKIANVRSRVIAPYSSSGYFGTFGMSTNQLGVIRLNADKYMVLEAYNGTCPNSNMEYGVSNWIYEIVDMKNGTISTGSFDTDFANGYSNNNGRQNAAYMNFMYWREYNSIVFTTVKKTDANNNITFYGTYVYNIDTGEGKRYYNYDKDGNPLNIYNPSMIGTTITKFFSKSGDGLTPNSDGDKKGRWILPSSACIYFDSDGENITYGQMTTTDALTDTSPTSWYQCSFPVLLDGVNVWSTYMYNENGNHIKLNMEIIGPVLMTINNLEEPVTKTSDKTMKITYTIQEV